MKAAVAPSPNEGSPVIEIRPYRPEDRAAWAAARDQQPEGRFVPDPEDKLNFNTLVATKDGRPFAFGYARGTAELFSTIDPREATPAEIWKGMTELIAGARAVAQKYGIREMHIFGLPEYQRAVKRYLSLPGIHFDDRIHLFVDVVPRGTEGAGS